jgi:hypothetical protein
MQWPHATTNHLDDMSFRLDLHPPVKHKRWMLYERMFGLLKNTSSVVDHYRVYRAKTHQNQMWGLTVPCKDAWTVSG